jgi:hypothetical protein
MRDSRGRDVCTLVARGREMATSDHVANDAGAELRAAVANALTDEPLSVRKVMAKVAAALKRPVGYNKVATSLEELKADSRARTVTGRNQGTEAWVTVSTFSPPRRRRLSRAVK